MIPELKTNLVDKIGKYVPLRKVSAHEWASACPRCGGRDRFRVNNEKGWFCRHCQGEPGSAGHWGDYGDFTEFAFNWTLKETLKSLGIDRKLSPQEIANLEAERKAAIDQQRKEETAKQAAVHNHLTQNGEWWRYHKSLETHPEARTMWNERGLSNQWIEYYRLGFCKNRDWFGKFQSDSLTIPYFRPQLHNNADTTWKVINLKHRLLMQEPPMGKYLPERAGAGNHLFFADLYQNGTGGMGDLLIVEGEIKAMVTWSHLWDGNNPIAPDLSVIGVPGHGWREEWLEVFNRAERVHICLDPDNDAQRAGRKLAAALGEKAKVILLPEKIDDLFIMGILDAFKLLNLLTR